jgi:hypothetical protein
LFVKPFPSILIMPDEVTMQGDFANAHVIRVFSTIVLLPNIFLGHA